MDVLFLEGMKPDIKNYVAKCETCQRMKYEAASPAGLLQSFLIPSQVWEDVLTDFIIELPKTASVDTILVVVDRLIKYGHFLALKHR